MSVEAPKPVFRSPIERSIYLKDIKALLSSRKYGEMPYIDYSFRPNKVMKKSIRNFVLTYIPSFFKKKEKKLENFSKKKDMAGSLNAHEQKS